MIHRLNGDSRYLTSHSTPVETGNSMSDEQRTDPSLCIQSTSCVSNKHSISPSDYYFHVGPQS